MSASASAVASAPSRRMTGRVADRSSTVDGRPAAAGPPSTTTAHAAASASGTSASVRGSAPAVEIGRGGDDRIGARERAGKRRRKRRHAQTDARRIVAAEMEVERPGIRHDHGRPARDERARPARELRLERREQLLRDLGGREHDGRRLSRIAPLELTQSLAGDRKPCSAHQPVDGICRDDGTSALGERGDERREVDARLGEVEAQRHEVRIPPGAALRATRAWPNDMRRVCHLAPNDTRRVCHLGAPSPVKAPSRAAQAGRRAATIRSTPRRSRVIRGSV